jgi:hypothetical protein
MEKVMTYLKRTYSLVWQRDKKNLESHWSLEKEYNLENPEQKLGFRISRNG